METNTEMNMQHYNPNEARYEIELYMPIHYDGEHHE